MAGTRRLSMGVPAALSGSALALLIALSAVIGLDSGRHQRDVQRLTAQRTAAEAATAAVEQRLRDDLARAELPWRLDRVKRLTTEVSDCLTIVEFEPPCGLLTTLRACVAAIIDYNASAARFPARLLGDLPPQIRLTGGAPAIDCRLDMF